MISAGRINQFQDIFKYIPKTIIAHDLGINNVRFNRLINRVEGFVLKDLFRLAALMEIKPAVLLHLVLEQAALEEKNQKKPADRRANFAKK
jgi:hypothetical protein